VATCPTNGFSGHKTGSRYCVDWQGMNRTKVPFRQYFRVPSKERAQLPRTCRSAYANPFAPWSRLTPTNWLVWLLAQSPVHFALERLIVGVIHKVYVL
jgi:hypothetical protein